MEAQGAQLVILLGTLVVVHSALCTAEQKKTCTSKNETLLASVTPVDPIVLLECDPSLEQHVRAVAPKFSAHKGDACAEDSAGEFASISDTLKGKAQWASDEHKLTVTEFPTESEKICFLCEANSAVACRIVVDIAKDAPSCKRGGDQPTNLNLTLAENQTVYFRCPEKTDTLAPPEGAFGADCRAPVAKPDGLVRRDNTANKTSSLTLETDPQTEETYCYECSKAPGDGLTAEKCFITVTTQTTTQAATQPPSNSPTTSGSVISKLSVPVVCGIVFATLKHL